VCLAPGIYWSYLRPRLKVFAWTLFAAQAVAWTINLSWLHPVTWAGLFLLGPIVGTWTGVVVPGRLVDDAEDGPQAHPGAPPGDARPRGCLGAGRMDADVALRRLPLDAALGDPVGDEERAPGGRLHGGLRRLVCPRVVQHRLLGLRPPAFPRGGAGDAPAQPGVHARALPPARLRLALHRRHHEQRQVRGAVRRRRVRAAGHPGDGQVGQFQDARDPRDPPRDDARRRRAASRPHPLAGVDDALPAEGRRSRHEGVRRELSSLTKAPMLVGADADRAHGRGARDVLQRRLRRRPPGRPPDGVLRQAQAGAVRRVRPPEADPRLDREVRAAWRRRLHAGDRLRAARRPLGAGAAAFGVLICYEDLFPRWPARRCAPAPTPSRSSPTTPGTARARPPSSTRPIRSCGPWRPGGPSSVRQRGLERLDRRVRVHQDAS
jgi:hypothetical protein